MGMRVLQIIIILVGEFLCVIIDHHRFKQVISIDISLSSLKIDNREINNDDIQVISEDLLQVKSNHFDYYIYFPIDRKSINVLMVYQLNTSDSYQLQMVTEDKDVIVFNPEAETQDSQVSQADKDQKGRALIEKLNQAAKDIEHFESQKDIVKIKATSQDYNVILKEIAKTFTMMNNDDKKIDTQILTIDITSGDINEFGAHIFDRQDIQGDDKITNHYDYRVKRVDNFYLAVRVKDDINVNIGLKVFSTPISTDTSMSTDYLYCIEGKKEVEGW